MINLLQHIDTNAQTLNIHKIFNALKDTLTNEGKTVNSFFLIYTEEISKYLKKFFDIPTNNKKPQIIMKDVRVTCLCVSSDS